MNIISTKKINNENINVKINNNIDELFKKQFHRQPWNSNEIDLENFYKKYHGKSITLTYSFDKNHYHYPSEKYLYFFEEEEIRKIYSVRDIFEQKNLYLVYLTRYKEKWQN